MLLQLTCSAGGAGWRAGELALIGVTAEQFCAYQAAQEGRSLLLWVPTGPAAGAAQVRGSGAVPRSQKQRALLCRCTS